MAEDLRSLILSRYSEALDNSGVLTQDSMLKSTDRALRDRGVNIDSTTVYNEMSMIKSHLKDVTIAENKRYETIFKKELELNQYLNRLKIETFKKESEDYKKMYAVKLNSEKVLVDIYKRQAETYKKIGESGKVSVGNLARLWNLEKEREKEQSKSLESKQAKFNSFMKKFEENTSQIIKGWLNLFTDKFLFDRFKTAISNFSSNYEQNFTEIAGRTGSNSRQENHDFITGTLDNIMSSEVLKHGLNFNKDVFPEITNAVKNGFTGEEAQSIAITNAIDKKIMPWLDTTSETWVQLQYNITEDSLKQIKGQQLLLQETREGNRILQQGVVASLTDALLPTLQSIDANGSNADTMGAAYEYVEQLMEKGMLKSDAVAYVKKLINAEQNTFGALTSGDTTQILMGIGAVANPDNQLIGAQNMINDTVGSLFGNTGNGIYGEIARGAMSSAFNVKLPSDDIYYKDLLKLSYTGKYAGDNSNLYDNKVSNLRENVTRTQDYDNNMENIATNMFDGWAMFPHGMEMATMLIDNVQAIKNILTAWISSKFAEILTKGLGKLLGMGGGSGGTSIISNLLTGGRGLSAALNGGQTAANVVLSGNKNLLGAGLKYNGLLGGLTQGGTQLTGGLTSGLGSAAVGTAAVAGGALMAGKGVGILVDTAKNWKDNSATDNTVGVTTGLMAAGGGGMLAAAGLGLASGPVGWIGLAIGAVGLLGKTIYDTVTKIGGASAAIDKEYEEQKEAIRKTTDNNIDNLTHIFDSLNDINASEKDIEEQRNNLIKSGLLTQKDEEKARNANKEQLKELTKAYLKSTESFGNDIETALDEYKAESKAWSDTAWGGMEKVLQKYNDNDGNRSRDDTDYIQAASGIMDTIYSDLEKQKQNGKLGKSEQHIYDSIVKARAGGYTSSELNDIIDAGWFNEHLQSMSVSSPDVINSIQTKLKMYNTDASREILKAMNPNNGDKYYNVEETADALSYLINAINTVDKDNAIEYLDEFKEKGYKLSTYNTQKKQLENKWKNEIDLSSYRSGSSYIQYDQIAQLHAKERVLTAEQNREYTENLIGSGSSTGVIEAGVKDVVSAIQEQTKNILEYLSSVGSNTFSYSESTMNMLPRMGNTRVVF